MSQRRINIVATFWESTHLRCHNVIPQYSDVFRGEAIGSCPPPRLKCFEFCSRIFPLRRYMVARATRLAPPFAVPLALPFSLPFGLAFGPPLWPSPLVLPFGPPLWPSPLALPFGPPLWPSPLALPFGLPFGPPLWPSPLALPFGPPLWPPLWPSPLRDIIYATATTSPQPNCNVVKTLPKCNIFLVFAGNAIYLHQCELPMVGPETNTNTGPLNRREGVRYTTITGANTGEVGGKGHEIE